MEKIRKIIPEERNYTVKCECSMCKNTTEVKVRYGDYLLRFAMNKPAQDCFPYLSVPERETIISGICLGTQPAKSLGKRCRESICHHSREDR